MNAFQNNEVINYFHTTKYKTSAGFQVWKFSVNTRYLGDSSETLQKLCVYEKLVPVEVR